MLSIILHKFGNNLLKKIFFFILFTNSLLLSQAWIIQESGTTKTLYNNTFADVNNGVVVGDNGLILKTSNGGTSWSQKTSGVSTALYGIATFGNSVFIATGDAGKILRSTNNGDTWIGINSGVSNYLTFVTSLDGLSGVAVGSLGKILATTDLGVSWTSQNSYVSSNLYCVDFYDSNNGIVVGENGTILRTTNGGNTWVGKTSGITSHLRGISYVSSVVVVAVGDGGVILRSTDGGETWNRVSSPSSQNLRGINIFSSVSGYIVGSNGVLLSSINAGQNWSQVTSPTIVALIGISSINANTYTATGLSGRIIQLKNPSIRLISPNGGEYLKIGSAQTISWSSTDVPFVKIELSTNGGSSWIQLASAVANNGTFPWSVENTPSNNCKIRVSYQNNSSINDFSDNTFTIGLESPYYVSLSSQPTNGGTVSGSGNYQPGQTVKVSATPNSGFGFANWTENGIVVSTLSEFTFTINGNRNLVANFTPTYQITVSNNPTNGGIVSGTGTYVLGAAVTLSANPNNGYKFVNWTENGSIVSSNNNYSFVVAENRNLVANYSILQYSVFISINPINSGVVTGHGKFDFGTTIKLNASPAEGYSFSSWSENGNTISSSSSYEFTVTGDRIIIANFVLNKYTLSVISLNGEIIKNPDQPSYNHGSIVSLSVVPKVGYYFLGWSGDANGTENPISITMNGNKTISANFLLKTHKVNIISENGTVKTEPDRTTYDYGSEVTLTALPKNGYTFKDWSGDVSGVMNPIQVAVTKDLNIIANFKIANRQPYFTRRFSDTTISIHNVKVPFKYQFKAIDPDGDRISFRLETYPTGSSIDSTGLFFWMPNINQAGQDYLILINASDGKLSETIAVSIKTNQNIVGIEQQVIPTRFALMQNYPNPFNPVTNIIYEIPIDNFVSLKVYDVQGNEIITLVNEFKNAGRYVVPISGQAKQLSSGLYFYELNTGKFRDVKKMILMK